MLDFGKSRFFMLFGYGKQRQAYPHSINGGTNFDAMLWYSGLGNVI